MPTSNARITRRLLALSAAGGLLFQLIPFSCGRGILNLVTPVFYDDAFSILDAIVAAVAPLVLPG